jgi:hypothetical protein
MSNTCPADYAALQSKYNNIQHKYYTKVNEQKQLANATNKLLPSLNKLQCGPECQRQKKIAELKQIYDDAVNNKVEAPSTLKNARKEYVVFDQGEPKYNEIIENELRDKAKIIAKSYMDQYEENMKQIGLLVITQESLSKSLGVMDMHNTNLTNSTAYGDDEIELTEDDIIMNDRKTYYENQNYNTLTDWYMFFSWIYWLLGIIFIISIFIVKNDLTIKTKILYTVNIVLYFLLMKYIIIYLLKLLVYLYNLLQKNVYNSM